MQASIDGEREVTPWDGSTVVRTAIQTSLDTATGIAVEDLLTLDTTQYLFVGALYSASADEVPTHDRAVTLEVGEASFGEVAQEVGGIVVVVLAYGTGAYREARELIQLLLEASYLLGLELREEDLWGVGVVAAVDTAVTYGGELLDDLFAR